MGEPDPATVCERCGYALAGLSLEGACPECAKPVRESLLGPRAGTPWQRRRGFAGWLSTTLGVLVGDPGVWRTAQTSGAPGLRLAILNSVLAPIVGSVGPVAVFFAMGDFRLAWGAFAWGLALALALVGASVISCWAMTTHAALNGRDLTPERAWIIVGHATSIWWFATLGVVFGAATFLWTRIFGIRSSEFVVGTGSITALVTTAATPVGYLALLRRGLRLTRASGAGEGTNEN